MIRSIFKISGTFEVGGEWSSFKPATNFIARVRIKKDKTIAHFNIYFDRIEFECAIAKKYTSLKILTGWGLFVKIMHFITALKFFFFCFFLLQNVLPFSGSNCTLPSEDRILKRSCPALCPRKYQKTFCYCLIFRIKWKNISRLARKYFRLDPLELLESSVWRLENCSQTRYKLKLDINWGSRSSLAGRLQWYWGHRESFTI